MTPKVAYFVDSTDFGGTEQVLLHLLAGIDRRRWQPVLFHHPEPGLSSLLNRARDLDIRVEAIPRLRGKEVVRGIWQLSRKIRDERPAIIHAHLSWPLACRHQLAAAGLARVSAVVATSHLFMRINSLRSICVQRLLAKAVNRYIAVSNEVARQLHNTFGIPIAKIQVVHNGIPLARYRRPVNNTLRACLTRNTGWPVILTLARLYEQKGLSYLLEAAALVPEAVFVVAGDGPDREALQGQARKLGIEERVVFLGFRQDIPDLLASCDLFVLPSLFEGLPLSILEAMAAGKPVISSAIGGTDEAIVNGETGLLVPPANPVELAKAMNSMLSDQTLAERMAAAGKARAEREFSVEIMVRRTTQIYEELLPSSARGCD